MLRRYRIRGTRRMSIEDSPSQATCKITYASRDGHDLCYRSGRLIPQPYTLLI